MTSDGLEGRLLVGRTGPDGRTSLTLEMPIHKGRCTLVLFSIVTVYGPWSMHPFRIYKGYGSTVTPKTSLLKYRGYLDIIRDFIPAFLKWKWMVFVERGWMMILLRTLVT